MATRQDRIAAIITASTGDDLVLKIDVLYGADDENRYTMAGYKYPNAPWVKLAYADRFKFTEKELETVLKRLGWTQDGRPVKQAGFAYHYAFKRLGSGPDAMADDPLPFVFSLHSPSYEEVERKRQRRLFDEWMNADFHDQPPH